MSKIARYQGNLRAFASSAQGLERTLFGETTQADDLTSQVTASFLRGWGVVGASEHPSLEDFNAAMYAMSQFIAYQHQVGIPEWHSEQEYYTGAVCTHGGVSYQSLGDDNVGNEPPSAQWTAVITAGNGGEFFQPQNAKLTAFSGLAGAANRLPYFTGANALALTALTAAGRDLIGQADVPAILEYLGLGNLPAFGTAASKDVGTGVGQIPDMSAFAASLGPSSGWYREPNGIIKQYGYTTSPAGNSTITPATFPIPFPNVCIGVIATIDRNDAISPDNLSVYTGNRSKTGFDMIMDASSSTVGGRTAYWEAKGY